MNNKFWSGHDLFKTIVQISILLVSVTIFIVRQDGAMRVLDTKLDNLTLEVQTINRTIDILHPRTTTGVK